MTRKFIYFINPISGTRNKDLVLEMINTKTAEVNIPFEIIYTNAAGRYDFLPQKIQQDHITDVIVCGGDGTVNQVAAALLQTTVNLGIIPMGSGNGLAFAAKIPKAAAKAFEVIIAGHSQQVDAFYINERFSCMLCGLGFDAQVAHDFARQKKRGLLNYMKQSARNFFRAPAYPFVITVDGKAFRTEAYFISIANSNQFGNHFTIAPRASLSDGLLDIVVVNNSNKLKMLYMVLKQVLSGQVKPYSDKKALKNGVGYFQTARLNIHNPSLAPLHIDGDPADTAEDFEIRVIPNAFRLLMP